MTIIASTFLAACASPSDPTVTSSQVSPSRVTDGYQRPPNVAWTNNWNPSPATDLMSADATFLRAYEEAQVIAALSGYTASRSYVGFTVADRTIKNPRLYEHGVKEWTY